MAIALCDDLATRSARYKSITYDAVLQKQGITDDRNLEVCLLSLSVSQPCLLVPLHESETDSMIFLRICPGSLFE